MENKKEFSNDWCFSGEIVRVAPFKDENRKDFYGSVVLRGQSKNELLFYSNICELTIFMRKKEWDYFNKIKKCYDNAEICGHFEQTATKTNPVKLVADLILN